MSRHQGDFPAGNAFSGIFDGFRPHAALFCRLGKIDVFQRKTEIFESSGVFIDKFIVSGIFPKQMGRQAIHQIRVTKTCVAVQVWLQPRRCHGRQIRFAGIHDDKRHTIFSSAFNVIAVKLARHDPGPREPQESLRRSPDRPAVGSGKPRGFFPRSLKEGDAPLRNRC